MEGLRPLNYLYSHHAVPSWRLADKAGSEDLYGLATAAKFLSASLSSTSIEIIWKILISRPGLRRTPQMRCRESRYPNPCNLTPHPRKTKSNSLNMLSNIFLSPPDCLTERMVIHNSKALFSAS